MHLTTPTVALLSLVLSSCASVSVTAYQENPALAPTQTPTKISALPAKAIFREESVAGKKHARGTLEETLYLEPVGGHAASKETGPTATGGAMAKATDRQLNRFLPGGPRREQELLIESRITAHARGSRAMRTLVGLGFGKTLLETKTRVFNTNKSRTEPWLEVWTTGSSNREPGAIFAAMPSPLLAFNILAVVGTGASLANGSGKGLTQDAKRTGKLVGSFILEKLEERGHPNTGKPAVKYSGSVPVPLTGETLRVPFTKTPPNANQTKVLP